MKHDLRFHVPVAAAVADTATAVPRDAASLAGKSITRAGLRRMDPPGICRVVRAGPRLTRDLQRSVLWCPFRRRTCEVLRLAIGSLNCNTAPAPFGSSMSTDFDVSPRRW